MLRITLFFLIFAFFATASFAQVNTAWVSRYDGIANGLDYCYAVAADANGNVYVTGRTKADPSGEDHFGTIKYDSDGKEIWVRRYDGDGPGTLDDYGHDLALDGSGNICVTGASNGSVTAYDYATIKYGPTGDTAWIQRYIGIGGSNPDWPNAIVVDNSGNVYVTGYSKGYSGRYEYATVKYLSDGTEDWVKRYGGAEALNYIANDIAVDDLGNSYVIGESKTAGLSVLDYVTIKYDSDGNEVWVKTYDGPGHGSDYGRAIAVDGFGNVYVTGQSKGANDDYATVKYLPDGTQDWVERYDASNSNTDGAYDVVVDGSGNIYVTGKSKGSTTNYDYATIKYTPSKGTEWVRRYDANNKEDEASALAVDGSGNVYVTGRSKIGTYYDYATVKYSTDGNEEWVVRYDGPANLAEKARDIFVDDQGNVYVTGDSKNANGWDDYATVKYSPPATAVELVNFEAIGKEGFIELVWMTEVEVDNYKWLITRSEQKDGSYKKIAEQDAIGNGPNYYTYTDSSVVPDGSYWYKLGDMNTEGKITWHGPVYAKPRTGTLFLLSLSASFPNPSRNTTKIEYQVPGCSGGNHVKVILKVYNVAGQLVKTLVDRLQKPGFHTIWWDGKDSRDVPVAPGPYFYRLEANGKLTGKLVHL